MEINEYFAQTLAGVLEETSTNMGNAMILDHLANKGKVSLEEAEFFHNLCTEVITEAAEDFIPDNINVPSEEEIAAQAEAQGPEGEIFYDKDGNAYMFSGGDMIPVDGDDNGELSPEDAGDNTMDPNVAPESEVAPVQESTEFSEEEIEAEIALMESEEAEEAVVEESTNDQNSEILEESDNVVSRILANLR